MAGREVAGSRAILVEGALDRAAATRRDAGLVALMQVLRASAPQWAVRRLPDREISAAAAAIELEVVSAYRDATQSVLIVLAGTIVRVAGELRLVVVPGSTGVDGTLALASLCPSAAVRRRVVVIVSASVSTDSEISDVEICTVFANKGVMAACAVSRAPALLETLAAALHGAARDARTGTLTATSLVAYLADHHVIASSSPDVGASEAAWFEPPSLERVWHLGGSTRTEGVSAVSPRVPVIGNDLVGIVLPGRFRIDACVASGNFGTVYRARQLSVDREVAVKVVRADIDAFSEDGRLFVQEIQAVARIDHPNVVRIYQADLTADGRLFFAMEFLAGRDLQSLQEHGPLDASRAIVLVRQLLIALDAAHRVGLVHADVKPANVIVVTAEHAERAILVDFGLARLRRPDDDTRSVGGTPAFMAPEQLRAGRVDARSDQFSAALVLVALLTGWRRDRASELAPPERVLAAIEDSRVRTALTRALAITPTERFDSVLEFEAALGGEREASAPIPEQPPFLGLASFTEIERGRLHGRDRELAQLTDLIMYRRLVIVTAPSGVGKTSLLRAGLLPRLEALEISARYTTCRADDLSALVASIAAAGEHANATVDVFLIDQIEDALDGARERALIAAIASVAGATHSHARILLSVREDFLARLLEVLPDRADGAPIVRIGPLDLDGATEAIVRPLAERRISLEPALRERLLADLTTAGLALGAELGWSAQRPVYPPHLQLACAVLYERLPADEATMTLAHYRELGGFDAIVAEHFERVLDALSSNDGAIAREVFLVLVGSAHLRSARTHEDLIDLVPAAQRARLPHVLDILRREGLIVRTRRSSGDLVWELIHDSVVPRIHAWLDRRDLSRRRAVEMVRHHVRRSHENAPSLLSRAELRELGAHTAIVVALEAEWQTKRDGNLPRWGPAAVVARSRLLHRRSRIAAVVLAATVVFGITAAIFERWRAGLERAEEAARRDRDLGLVTFELSAFDWDPIEQRAHSVPVAELPELAWSLRDPSFEDPSLPGDDFPAERLHRLDSRQGFNGDTRQDDIEARGGAAFLVISGRGRRGETCPSSVIPLRSLPGYARRAMGSQGLRIDVPTCRASVADMVMVPAGPFLAGGVGEPPSPYAREFPERVEREVSLPSYRIGRTETTNAAFAMFGAMRDVTGIAPPSYIPNHDLANAAELRSPVSSLTWREARAYCAYLGARLPTSDEWEKALRGGLTVDGISNPAPRRNFPWGARDGAHDANLSDELPKGVKAVGSYDADISPYGVVDLAGNLSEWVSSAPAGTTNLAAYFRDSWRIVRGGNWGETPRDDLVNFMPIENARPGDTRSFMIGARCATAY